MIRLCMSIMQLHWVYAVISFASLVSGDTFTKPKNCSTDVAIAEGIISTHQVPNIATCQKKCEDDPNCMGFNYEVQSAKKCMLNSDVAGPEGAQLSYGPSFTYTEKLDENAPSFKTTSCKDYVDCRPMEKVDPYEHLVSRDSTYGYWGKDCALSATDDYYYDMRDTSNKNVLKVYTSKENFISDYYTSITLPFGCNGANHVVYKRVFYCGGYNTNQVYTYDLDAGAQSTTISFSNVEGRIGGYQNQCPYHLNHYSDIDMASDERGLWVLWGRYNENCAFAISKIDPDTKTIVKTWFPPKDIELDANNYGNAFMICGNMYVMNHYHTTDTYIRWVYYTGNSSWVEVSGSNSGRIILPNHNGHCGYLNYNPRDKKLYSWNNVQRNRYQVHFRDWDD